MSIPLPDARQLSDEALQVLRLRALRGIELGYSELDLADLLGVCHQTISRWWTAYRAEGLQALPGGRTGRPLGSGRFLSDQQAQRIKRASISTPRRKWVSRTPCGRAAPCAT
jgi:transposase